MNRIWMLASLAALLTLITPAYSQRTNTLSPGEEGGAQKPPATTEQKPGATNTPAATTPAATSAPAVLWKNPQSGDQYATSSVKFVLESRDNISEVDYIEYKIDNSEFRRYAGPITIPEQGPHTITYRSVDKAGNREVDRIYSVTIDDNGPLVRVLPAAAFVTRDGKNYTPPSNTFTIRASDEFSGVKEVLYGVNSSELKAYREGEAVQITASGTQLINFQGVDNLGNKTTGSVLVEVDADKPVVEIKPTQPLTKVDQRQYARRNTGFRVEATDLGSGIQTIMVRIDGAQEWQAYSDVIFFDAEKEHVIEARAIDAVGNESEIKTLRFVVDDNPPTTELRTSVE